MKNARDFTLLLDTLFKKKKKKKKRFAQRLRVSTLVTYRCHITWEWCFISYNFLLISKHIDIVPLNIVPLY